MTQLATKQKKEQNTGITSQSVTPLTMLNMAIEKGTSMEQLEHLMALKERWDANESKKAYVVAMSAFKADPPKIIKDMLNKQYGSKYSSLGNFVNTVNPELSKHGLSAKWEIDQSQTIKVSCVMTHVMGHSESVSMSAPPDTSGQKNPIQQIKSTVTYLELATFQAITGLVSSDATLDDDGNRAGDGSKITEQQAADLQCLAEEVKADVPAFLKYLSKYGKLSITTMAEIPAGMHKDAVACLEAKRKNNGANK